MTNEEILQRSDLWAAFREIVRIAEGYQEEPTNPLVIEYMEEKKNGKA